jgi:SAM-dependent methyltransferase
MTRPLMSRLKSAKTPVPPDDLWDVGGGDFAAVGNEFLVHFREIGGLKPSDDVLDMGCGVGRMAVPLAGYLNRSGTYAGFDIAPVAIKWCRQNVSRLHRNFDFQVADLYNKRYNPEGKTKSVDFRFPYGDDSFDFALATSLFTHLLPEDMEHYLAEASRVVRPGGTLFLTFYLLNEEILARKDSWARALSFDHVREGCRTNSDEIPEAVVAYDEGDVQAACGAAGLTLERPIRYGRWSGASEPLSVQDVLLVRA